MMRNYFDLGIRSIENMNSEIGSRLNNKYSSIDNNYFDAVFEYTMEKNYIVENGIDFAAIKEYIRRYHGNLFDNVDLINNREMNISGSKSDKSLVVATIMVYLYQCNDIEKLESIAKSIISITSDLPVFGCEARNTFSEIFDITKYMYICNGGNGEIVNMYI